MTFNTIYNPKDILYLSTEVDAVKHEILSINVSTGSGESKTPFSFLIYYEVLNLSNNHKFTIIESELVHLDINKNRKYTL